MSYPYRLDYAAILASLCAWPDADPIPSQD
jgi:hypothetical protein